MRGEREKREKRERDHQYDHERHPTSHNTISSVSTLFCAFVGTLREVTGVKVEQIQLKTLIFSV